MCGIVGIVGDFSTDTCLEVIRKMGRAIEHRGPDESGYWAEDGFGFGVQRLSIIDLKGGQQPMWDDGGELGVVFNGEVYNYRDVREVLVREGHCFRTNSDTEVALRSLAHEGLEAAHQWNGMYALAAWHRGERKLWLIRDRMGVKPLYYYWDGKVFLFASEIKAILASGVVERRVNRQSVWDYLTFRFVPGPETIWHGIRKLPPGHTLELTPGREPKESRYWSTDVLCRNGHAVSEAEQEEEFAELFTDAVRLRITASDVPVGLLLSGGLDSSAVSAVAVELGHRNFHTFSVGFDTGGYYSELPDARNVARLHNTRHHEIAIGRDEFIELLPETIHYSDEPLADLASVPTLAVCRLARQEVKVVLSGEGADEVLGGYDLGRMERVWDVIRTLQRVPGPVLGVGRVGANLLLLGRYHNIAKRIAHEPLSDWNRSDLPHMTKLWGQGEKQELWPGAACENSERILEQLFMQARSPDPLQQTLSVNQKAWLVEDLLMKADKMSMATSVELRTPFLDYRLVEWANRQPNSVKVRKTGIARYETKHILRRFCAGRLPEEVVKRRKRGFPVPAYQWLQAGLETWAAETLLAPAGRLFGAFDQEAVKDLLRKSREGDLTAAHQVWSLIVLELWLRAWEVNLD